MPKIHPIYNTPHSIKKKNPTPNNLKANFRSPKPWSKNKPAKKIKNSAIKKKFPTLFPFITMILSILLSNIKKTAASSYAQ